MCEYCGCQQITVISELTAEHDRLRELGHDLATAASRSDLAGARPLAAEMRKVLGPHTAVEEDGLFPALSEDFGDPIGRLVDEHRTIDATLGALADLAEPDGWPTWAAEVERTLHDLFEHILKEQDGVFPAALSMLSPAEWDAVAAARKNNPASTSAAVTPVHSS